MKKILCLILLTMSVPGEAFSQIGWWTSSDTLNVFNKNKGSVLIGSYQPLGKLTVGPDDKFYNLSLVGDYNNLAKNYLQIGVTGRGFENLQGQTIFDLYHSNKQPKNAGYNFRINGNSQFFINGDGNIGIGTEKPEAKLDLSGGPNWGGFTKALRIPAEHAIKFESSGNEYGMVATGGSLNFVLSNQNETANPFGVPFRRIMSLQRNKVVIEGDVEVKGKIYSQGQVSNGGDVIPIETGGGGGQIDNGKGGGGGILPTIAQQGSGLQDWEYVPGNPNIFYTYQNGKVGIGTTAPQSALHVRDSGDGADQYSGIRITPASSATTGLNSYHRLSGFRKSGLHISGSTNGSSYAKSNMWFNDTGFFVGMSDGSSDPFSNVKMAILNGGSVGIGTASPGQKLEVVGLNGTPGISGSTADGILRLQPTGSNAMVDFGMRTSGACAWIQPRDKTNFATNYNLALNPNGGSVGIGTLNPDANYKLNVNGKIKAQELYLTTNGWSDFVFEQGYNLRSLKQVENYIHKYGRLPEIPSQKEVAEKGVGVIDMQSKLLQKIEELTLYLIEQNKQITEQNQKNEEQNKRILSLEEKLNGKK